MAKQAAAYKYRPRDAESVKKRAEQDGGAFDSIFKSGIDTWRAKVGDNLIRFLPPTWDDPEHYGYDVWVHGYIGADNGSYLCPKKMLNKRCPICEAQKEAADAGDADEAKALKAKKMVAAWIIDRDEDNPTPQVYLMSWTMDRDIAALCHNKRTGKVIMIDNPETGFDFTIKRVGAGLKTRYFGLAVDRDASPMMDSQKDINKIMEYVEDNPIPDILAYKDVEYLEGIIEGTNAKDKGEEEATPRRRRGAASEDDAPPARRRRGEEPPDEEAPPTRRRRGEEPPDEDPPPRRRRSEPEADPEDDPPPRRRRAEPEPDAEDPPPRRRRAEPEPEDDPPPRRRRAEPEDEPPAEDDPPPRRRRAEPEADPEDDPPPRRRRSEPEADPEDDPPPRRRRSEPEPDAEDPPPRRRRAEPEAEEDPPRRRRAAEPEDDPPPRRRR